MKLPLTLTFLILAAGAFWGLREQQSLTALLEKQREIQRKAETLGVSTDASQSANPTKITRRQREDGNRNIKAFADTCVAFSKDAKELEKSGKQPDLNRHLEMLDGMYALNGEELKLLIAELWSRTDIDYALRAEMLVSTINTLAERDPQAALALLAETPDFHEVGSYALTTALSRWAADQPHAALDWIRKHADQYPHLVTDHGKQTFVEGVAQQDFAQAFQLAGELKLSVRSEQVMVMANLAADSPERQAEFIAALRQQASQMTDKRKAEELLRSGTTTLFAQIAPTGFDKTMAWLASSGFNEKEVAGVRDSLYFQITKADTGKWVEWISSQSDPTHPERDPRHLVRDWTSNDYKAAGEWLTKAPAGPMKENATLSYLTTIAPYDSETATRWAETLSGEKRTDAMKRIHHMLKQSDKSAAADFAKRQGLTEE